MIYSKTLLLFLRVFWSRYFDKDGKGKYSLAAARLFGLSYRLSDANNKSFVFFFKAFAHAILAKKIRAEDACHIYSGGGLYFYDSPWCEQSENQRLGHLQFFLKEKPAGSIWKTKLLGYFRLGDKVLQVIFECILAIFLLPVSLFEKYKGSTGLIFWEYIELVNLQKLLKRQHVRTLYFYSIYEKDSNITSIALQNSGITVKKISSSTPLKFWNKIIVACDTLILCDTFQLEELKLYSDTIQVKNIELWGPENIHQTAKYYNKPIDPASGMNVIGFYSSAAYQRSEHGDLDEWNFEKNENTVMLYLAEYLKRKAGIKLLVFPHPREKTPENRDAMLKHYNDFFSGLDFSIYEGEVFSSACFDKSVLGISMFSSVVYERLYYGFKCLMMPFEEEGMGKVLTSIKNICAHDKTDFFSKIELFLNLPVDKYFEKTGLPESPFIINRNALANRTREQHVMLKTAPPHAKKPNIVIVDYGLGNPASIQNMLRRLGYNSLITSAVEAIHAADKIILPGVGAFAKGMQNLKEARLSEILNRKVLQEQTPVLGICLGMQLMTLHSEEGNADGLGWIPAQTKKFSFNDNAKLPVPHMGWMDINIEKNHPLFRNSGNNPRYYFAHSYYISHDTPYSIATATYGITFACAFARENIMGVQFHPEKSHSFGLNILNNFILHL